MPASLDRVILFVQDVPRLKRFYADAFGLPLVEQVGDEWAVLNVGGCELALHRVGEAYRVDDPSTWMVETNVKLVLTVTRELGALRDELAGKGVQMGEIRSFPGVAGPLCDGRDPEGNVFQLIQAPG